MGSVIGIAFYCGEATVVSNYQSTAPHAFAYETAGLDDKENGYQEQSQSSWGKQKWRPDEEDRDGDTSQPRSNKDASDDCSKSSSEEPMSNSSATRSYDHSWSDNSCCKEPTFSSNGGSLRIVLDPSGVMTDPQIWIMVAKVFQRRSSVIRR